VLDIYYFFNYGLFYRLPPANKKKKRAPANAAAKQAKRGIRAADKVTIN